MKMNRHKPDNIYISLTAPGEGQQHVLHHFSNIQISPRWACTLLTADGCTSWSLFPATVAVLVSNYSAFWSSSILKYLPYNTEIIVLFCFNFRRTMGLFAADSCLDPGNKPQRIMGGSKGVESWQDWGMSGSREGTSIDTPARNWR